MNRLFIFAAVLGLLVSAPASAQRSDNDRNKNDAEKSHADRGAMPSSGKQNGNRPATARQQGRAEVGNAPAKPVDGNRTVNGGASAGRSNTSGAATRPTTGNNSRSTISGDTRPGAQGRATTNNGRGNSGMSGNNSNRQPAANTSRSDSKWSGNAVGRRTDIGAMRRNMQAPKRFRSGNYRAPQGYQYRHWSYGERLPRGYFIRNYWIANFTMFGLFAPPSDLVWVRVGDDALLVDRDSGEIVQVRYGVFY